MSCSRRYSRLLAFSAHGGEALDEAERRRYLEIVRATPALLKAALKGVPKAVLLYTPAPGKWSILEIVCHLRDMERDAYLERYRRILAEDTPRLPDIDGDAHSLEGDYRNQKLSDALREWTRDPLKPVADLHRDERVDNDACDGIAVGVNGFVDSSG